MGSDVHIGLSQQIGKLVFVAARPKLSVIANQSADWCGNPPVRGEMYRQLLYGAGNLAIFGDNRNLVPFNRGIATTSVRTGLAMTALFFKQQFIVPSERNNIWRPL